MFIDPIIIQWALIGGASFAAFMIGLGWSKNSKEAAINDTIIYLIENNFVKSRLVDGEHELIPLDEE